MVKYNLWHFYKLLFTDDGEQENFSSVYLPNLCKTNSSVGPGNTEIGGVWRSVTGLYLIYGTFYLDPEH